MRIADMMISFPGIILAIAISGIMGPSLINAMLALTVVTWTKYARLSRSLVLKLKESEFVEAAIVSGGTHTHILCIIFCQMSFPFSSLRPLQISAP